MQYGRSVCVVCRGGAAGAAAAVACVQADDTTAADYRRIGGSIVAVAIDNACQQSIANHATAGTSAAVCGRRLGRECDHLVQAHRERGQIKG